MKSSSYIAMPSEKAAKLAQACIDRILAARERRRAKYVKYTLAEWNTPSFWDKVFRREPKKHTEKEVREHLEKQGGISYHLEVDIVYGAQLDIAYCILNASKHADMVNITVTDLAKIS